MEYKDTVNLMLSSDYKERFKAEYYQTKIRYEKLKKLNIPKLKVVYSEEPPLTPIDDQDISCRFHCICPNKDMRKCTERRTIPASNAWVPAAAGLIIGGEVVKDMINRAGTMRLHCEDK